MSVRPKHVKATLVAGRWVLFSNPIAKGDKSHVTVMDDCDILSGAPSKRVRMSDQQRKQQQVFQMVDGNYISCHFFARVESSVTKAEALLAAGKIEARYKDYLKEVTFGCKAYEKLVESFPESIFYGFTYPDESKDESYVRYIEVNYTLLLIIIYVEVVPEHVLHIIYRMELVASLRTCSLALTAPRKRRTMTMRRPYPLRQPHQRP
jgi:hypothetical protein